MYDQTRHEELKQALYEQPKRICAGYLLIPDTLDKYYRLNNTELTPTRREDIQELLRAALRDPEHNPITTRETILQDIRHELGYLTLDDAKHYIAHPQCFLAYLVNTYRKHAAILLEMTGHEIDNFHAAILAVIETHQT